MDPAVYLHMGMNAITIYIIANVVSFQRLAGRLVGGNIHSLLGPYGDLIQALLGTLFCFWLVCFLYRKQIFLRL